MIWAIHKHGFNLVPQVVSPELPTDRFNIRSWNNNWISRSELNVKPVGNVKGRRLFQAVGWIRSWYVFFPRFFLLTFSDVYMYLPSQERWFRAEVALSFAF